MNLEDLFSGTYAGREDERRRMAREARRQCEAVSHQYQVIGSKSPTGLRCNRCHCTWQIGPKTEPTLP